MRLRPGSREGPRVKSEKKPVAAATFETKNVNYYYLLAAFSCGRVAVNERQKNVKKLVLAWQLTRKEPKNFMW